MLFKPHPIQVQALGIARRFQRGFKPIRINGQPLATNSLLSSIKFDSVPAFVLSAEIGHSTEYAILIDELCQRGYFVKHEGYRECPCASVEYVTEDGTKVYVRNKHWGEIDVLPPNAKSIRRHLGGFSGEIRIGKGAKPSHRKRKPKIVGKGSSYELTPKGFDLLDQVEAEDRIDTPTMDQGKPSRGQGVAAGDLPDENGYVLRPIDPAAYIPLNEVLNQHAPGEWPLNTKLLVRIVENYTVSRVRWTRPLDKKRRPIANRRNVHLGDWHAYLKSTTRTDAEGFPMLSEAKIKANRAQIDRGKASRK